jgi:hypothetical protein
MAVEMEQIQETLQKNIELTQQAQSAVTQVQEAESWVHEIQTAYDGASGLTIALCVLGGIILLRPLLALIQYIAVFFVIFMAFKYYV